MTTTFPGSPRLLKGALVALGPGGTPSTSVIFQYNPEKMTRRLDARTAGGAGAGASAAAEIDRAEPLRLEGPPRESITLKIVLDATDAMEEPKAPFFGLSPQIAAMESWLYPLSTQIITNKLLAAAGSLAIVPQERPLLVFVWGPKRILPVRLTSLSIDEQAYDNQLNPLRAEIDLSLSVLSSYEFKSDHPGFTMHLTHQITLEVLSRMSAFNSISQVGFSVKL